MTWGEVRQNARGEERNEKKKANIAKRSRQNPGTTLASILTKEKKYRNQTALESQRVFLVAPQISTQIYESSNFQTQSYTLA